MTGVARNTVLIVATVWTLLTGCANTASSGGAQSPDSEEVLTVSEAVAVVTGPVQVRGYVLVGADGVTRLCTGLAGSYPPQCGAPSLIVEGLAAEAIPNRESDQGIVWGGEITLRGTLAAGVLHVE